MELGHSDPPKCLISCLYSGPNPDVRRVENTTTRPIFTLDTLLGATAAYKSAIPGLNNTIPRIYEQRFYECVHREDRTQQFKKQNGDQSRFFLEELKGYVRNSFDAQVDNPDDNIEIDEASLMDNIDSSHNYLSLQFKVLTHFYQEQMWILKILTFELQAQLGSQAASRNIFFEDLFVTDFPQCKFLRLLSLFQSLSPRVETVTHGFMNHIAARGRQENNPRTPSWREEGLVDGSAPSTSALAILTEIFY